LNNNVIKKVGQEHKKTQSNQQKISIYKPKNTKHKKKYSILEHHRTLTHKPKAQNKLNNKVGPK
jgi:hypothetical protein